MPGDHPLTIEPKDSGYEIAEISKKLRAGYPYSAADQKNQPLETTNKTPRSFSFNCGLHVMLCSRMYYLRYAAAVFSVHSSATDFL